MQARIRVNDRYLWILFRYLSLAHIWDSKNTPIPGGQDVVFTASDANVRDLRKLGFEVEVKES